MAILVTGDAGFVGSNIVRALPEKLLKEDIRLYPYRVYDIRKYTCELLTKRYGNFHGFDAVSVCRSDL